MGATCLFFAGHEPPADRVQALARWYGEAGVELVAVRERSSAWWLEPPPDKLSDGLLDATAPALRGLRTGLVTAARGERVRLVTGPCGPTSLYRADGVFATHAVAAAYLARGRARIDPAALPEIERLGYVGGDRSLIAGVTPVGPATCIDAGADGVAVWDYWPAAERWAPVASRAAGAHVTAALLSSLEERLRGVAEPWLGLTAGLDSQVVAAAAAELGLPVRTFTWALEAADSEGGAALAARLGLPHAALEPNWLGWDEGLALIDREVRFNEGLGNANAFGAATWPEPLSAFVTGGGGEVGRAFWWRRVGRNHAEPSPAQACDALLAPTADQALREHVLAQLEALAAAGVRGWSLLDVLYAEQRLARWGRGMVSREAPSTIAAFADAEILRGLASLPRQARLSDGFHRGFLRERGLAVAPAPRVQRRGVPAPARRLAARRRRARPRPAVRSGWAGQLSARPGYAEWLRDGVLGHPAVVAAFGADWAERARAEFESHASVEAALTLSGPVALAAALERLGPGVSGPRG
ncbi:MAG: hypothetical protein WKF94_06990 [Solirubrobacteraceae bacterium]